MHREKHMVVVAQLAEHRIVVPSVAGSSPVFHPQIKNIQECIHFLDVFLLIFISPEKIIFTFILNINKQVEKYMTFSNLSNPIFEQAISDYHILDNVDAPIHNPYQHPSIEYYLYLKNWIDTVQWHLEDIIRDPDIDPIEASQN